MQELSMTILDIAENSVRAKARLVDITLGLDAAAKTETLTIADDGCGMSAEMVAKVTDPFTTTRTTRKVGLGLPFLKMAAEQTGGSLSIQSRVGVGTTITAVFGLGHIDLAPLGDIGSTVSALCGSAGDADVRFTYTQDKRSFVFDTRQARQILGDVPLDTPEVALFIRDHVNEGVQEIVNS